MFVYCENNPVFYIDPFGTRIIVPKEYDYGKAFTILKSITDDTLKKQKNSTVTIKKLNNKYKRFSGTMLIRSLINSKFDIYIYFSKYNSQYNPSSNNAYYYSRCGSGSGGIININVNSATWKSPLNIRLAHELVHAYRGIWGKVIPNSTWNTTYNCPAEEVYTIGIYKPHIWQAVESVFSENQIRKENGLILRNAYAGW